MQGSSGLFQRVQSAIFSVFLNKYLKHVFNIVLKLNNHIWKKLQNYFFVEKNEAQTSGFVVAEKAPSLWKKLKKKKKKNRPGYLRGYDLQKHVRKFFLNEWFSRYLSFCDFKVPKSLFTIKLLIKLDREKIKKILHTVLETIISRIIS